ncbi:uncharacterized protein LOC127749575 [Frankliniella occidentalis]|uniref:Uncharacterized protein LOC127749575 n=1 Tax=Frankliniella occidentalis TaxID=133901 RepID=A0A9C6U6X0_FRAOC|nr:uncharacterized protein LOC127749575 [Frankliniella occidentalis]
MTEISCSGVFSHAESKSGSADVVRAPRGRHWGPPEHADDTPTTNTIRLQTSCTPADQFTIVTWHFPGVAAWSHTTMHGTGSIPKGSHPGQVRRDCLPQERITSRDHDMSVRNSAQKCS